MQCICYTKYSGFDRRCLKKAVSGSNKCSVHQKTCEQHRRGKMPVLSQSKTKSQLKLTDVAKNSFPKYMKLTPLQSMKSVSKKSLLNAKDFEDVALETKSMKQTDLRQAIEEVLSFQNISKNLFGSNYDFLSIEKKQDVKFVKEYVELYLRNYRTQPGFKNEFQNIVRTDCMSMTKELDLKGRELELTLELCIAKGLLKEVIKMIKNKKNLHENEFSNVLI